ncbi:hypothetical protein E4K72_12800 [Oxalobacteraceae bacterium OM1]|nr:hypothetical protein E4K72_12800 [Oxalobacteraceae bacterium OM1]
MAPVIYLLCALTVLACAFLTLRSYRRTGHRLLLWSGLCFSGMTINNLFLIADRFVLPDEDLTYWRLGSALIALLPLLYGLVWEED